MIELTEEAYDSEVVVELVAALNIEINERYADDGGTVDPGDENYLAEVTPGLVTRPVGAFLVARVDGRPVGCGAVKPYDGSTVVAEVKRMYTEPSVRRRGVGRAILARLEAVASELRYERIQLETGTAQPEAIALYESTGWHRIDPYGFYKDSPQSVCFAKDLTTR